LDPVSEAQVLTQLLESRQSQTTILISHRPKVIQRADWIIMLEQGKLKIQGTPQDLSSQSGAHLDFLDHMNPSTHSWVFESSSYSSQGNSSTNGHRKTANMNNF
ncbi:MAG: hypothetical protein AB4038_21430, partial [Prochloraceae cyanobacterium]